MRVLICSDTHGKHDTLLEVLEKQGPFDLLIHCGDTEGGEYTIRTAAGCDCKIVKGNNDYFSDLPKEAVFSLGGKKIWVIHGHTCHVSLDTAMIKNEARQMGVDVVIFGHTHKPFLEQGDIWCINPGSISYPRQVDRRPSYMILNIDRQCQWDLELRYV